MIARLTERRRSGSVKPHTVSAKRLDRGSMKTKENPAGLDAGFSAAGSGIQGLSCQLFAVGYDRLQRKQQRCLEEYVLTATLL